MELKGSKTEKNLKEAFAGESQARNKYTYFASVAKKEGYEKISATFLETADNEREHAKLELRQLGGISNTIENLKECIAGENFEHTSMYPNFAKEAREEGFTEIAEMFEKIAAIEKEHEARFREMLNLIESQTVFKKDAPTKWHCRNCGHIHEGPEAPDVCPTCNHPQAYFEVFCECW
ncbi:MAG: rubrerythrin [Ignavibacteriales bacterium]